MHESNAQFWRRARQNHAAFFDRSDVSILEVGSQNLNGSVRDLLDLKGTEDYVGVDWRPGPGVDVVCLAHNMNFGRKFDVVLSASMLEHDPHWEKSISAMIRHLKPDGILILSWGSALNPPHCHDTSPDGLFHPLPAGKVLNLLERSGLTTHEFFYEGNHFSGYVTPRGMGEVCLTAFPAGSRPGSEPHIDPLLPEDRGLIFSPLQGGISFVIPTMNGASVAVGALAQLASSLYSARDSELIVVDNGSEDGLPDYLERWMPRMFGRFRLIRNRINLGFPAAVNQGLEACTGKTIAVLHSDLFFLDRGWDLRIEAHLLDRSVGLIGVAGCRELGADGGRSHVISNLLDAEQHGERSDAEADVAAFDSLALITRRETWAELGGLDERFYAYHYSDKDVSLRVLDRGMRNLYLGIRCHHSSGIGAEQQVFRDQMQREVGGVDALHEQNLRRYLEKWKHKLPVRV